MTTNNGNKKLAYSKSLMIRFIRFAVFCALSSSRSSTSSYSLLEVNTYRKYANLICTFTIANDKIAAHIEKTKIVASKGIDLGATPNGASAWFSLWLNSVCTSCKS